LTISSRASLFFLYFRSEIKRKNAISGNSSGFFFMQVKKITYGGDVHSGIRSEGWFRKVFDESYDHLRNYLYYLSGDIYWVDDTIQEVFMTLWTKRFSVREETLLPWLYTIGRNLFLKQKRHEAVRLKFEKRFPAEEPWGEDPGLAEQEEFDARLLSAISSMPEKCRTVFLMSRMDEMSNGEIASRLGVSVKAVEKHITKALRILRQKLEDLK